MNRYNELLHEAYQQRDENPLAWSLVEIVDATVARCLLLEKALGTMAHKQAVAADEALEVLKGDDDE